MKKIGIVIGLIVLIFAVYGIYQSPLFRIQSIEFNSSYDMDLDTLMVHTGLEIGTLYFSVDVEKIREGLLRHPFVKNAAVNKVFPNSVKIEIEYRQHFVTVRYLDVLISIDDEMVVLGVLNKARDGFVIEGIPFETYSAGRVIDVVRLYVLQNIISYVKLFNLAKMTPDRVIRFKDNCILFQIEGITVNFGLGENYEKRFNDFVVIYNSLKEDGVDSGTIDISSDGSPGYQPFGER
ncbi:MAG: FtsQ-type POTRA domain-containing protein [Bacillota bacterium]|nr:FtsQ-type POTRA domain-containing protein [Bacillota bacterium]